ncbi:MAG: hypothetical protein ACOZFS_04515 [Thermodesulfobacteriota bacterium]
MNGYRIGDGVDLRNYTWVDVYLKGQKYQQEIDELKREIQRVQQFPKAKKEILEELKGMGDQITALRIEKVRAVLSRFQRQEITGLTPHVFAQVWIGGGGSILGLAHTAAHDFASILAGDIIDAAIEGLPDGITQEEKAAQIVDLEAKIAALTAKIEKECWPDSRKVFDNRGHPRPGQDRWQEVVDHWRKVAAPYNKPVDFYGYAIDQSDPAWEAFRKLGFRLAGDTSPRPRKSG